MNNLDFNKFRVPSRPLNGFGLEGFLVGIGKIHKDGSRSYRTLDRPIHNKIVSGGVDQLLMLNSGYAPQEDSLGCFYFSRNLFGNGAFGIGSNQHFNDPNYWNYTYAESGRVGNHGPLSWCSYGTGDTPTDYLTTNSLDAMVGSRYDEKYLPRGSSYSNYPYHGTRELRPGTLAMRVSHISPIASDNTEVKEIGYWKGSNSVFKNGVSGGTGINQWRLFSRIVLPSSFSLIAGERLITTYELRIIFADYDQIPGDFGAGILDTDGNMLKVVSRRTLYQNTYTLSGDTCYRYNFPHITEYGGGALYMPQNGGISTNPNNSAICTGHPKAWPHLLFPNSTASNQAGYGGNLVLYSTSDRDFPAWGSYDSGLSIDSGASRPIFTASTYTEGTHYYDVAVTLPQYWPNMTANTDYVDLHYLNVAGVAYRFGHYEGGTWVPQALRKTAAQQLRFTFRTMIVTPDDLT